MTAAATSRNRRPAFGRRVSRLWLGAALLVLALPAAAAEEPDQRIEAKDLFRVGLGISREISPAKGAEALAEAVKRDPTNALYAIYLADAIYLSGDRNSANEVVAGIPKLIRDKAMLYFYEGKRAQITGNEDDQLYNFRESLMIKPTEYAFYELAALELKRNELQAAETDLMIALKLFPDDYYLNNLMGSVRHEQGRYAEALDSFNAAIKANSSLPWARINRGLTYETKGEYDKALQDFDAVLSVYPDQDQAKFFKALTLEKMKRYGAAREIVEKLAEANPLDATLWLMQGWLDYETDKVAEGEALLLKYIKQKPDDAEGHYKLATLYAGRRKTRDAFARLRRALELDRVQTMLWIHDDAEWDRYRDTDKFKALLAGD